MKTRISVIIPIYNIQEFLEECIDSVLAQTINNMELTDGYERNLQIILVDDGSTDNSAQIAKAYAEKYDNVQYVYEENQGLGHARNYGCEFVEGDYIVFLDSDDLVPPKAYERMYNASIRNDSDMTIGAVLRFTSKSRWVPLIHRKVFSGTDDVTHITEFPELFYDTTAWNKLIKFSFWKEHNFKFAEGVLYEDIPVTIPMHFFANKVSIIYEYCYLWRMREGISKSITQTTDETKTLNDRILAMKSVDEFFRKNITNEEMFRIKDIKWLQLDLMLFIDKFKSINEDESEELIEMLCDYINNNIDSKRFDELNEIDKLKYEYLLNKDFKRLVKLLNFEYYDMKNSKAYEKDSHVMIDVDKDICKTSSICIDQHIKESKKYGYLQHVSYKEEYIQIEGLTVIPGLKDINFFDREYSFHLVNSESHKRIPLEFEDKSIGKLKYAVPYGQSVSYDASGYRVFIPYSDIIDNPDFMGENRLLISFNQNGVFYNYFAKEPRGDVKLKSDLKAKLVGDTYIFMKYDYNGLIMDISSVKNSPDKIKILDNKLSIHTPENQGDIYLFYEKDSVNPERKIKLDYDSSTGFHSIDIDEISKFEGVLIYDDGEPVVHKKREFRFVTSDKGNIVVNTLRDYRYKIHRENNLTTISYIDRVHSVFEMDTTLYSIDANGKKINSATLYFIDRMNNEINELAKGEYKDKENNIIRFSVDLKNKEVKKNLYAAFHDLFVKYDLGDISFSTPLYLLNAFSRTYEESTFHYNVYRSNKSKLRMKVTRSWKKYENTRSKRIKNAGIRYRIFRHLPINKKRIMFESWWGQKYHCNPRHLYEYINENYPEYECIWSLNDEHTPIKGNAKRVRRFSLKYFYYLATSKYFVNNVNFNDHYIKRDGQIELQTMHGTPLKTLGFDVPGELETKQKEKNFIRRCDRWNYLLVQSDFVADVTKSCYRYKKELLKVGYPRTDNLYTKNNKQDINQIKEKLGIPLDKKVILYAPTWRIRNKFDLMLDLDSFRKSLSDEYILILRLHPFSVKGWKQPKEDDFVYDLSKYDIPEDLYLVSDILITDYSSLMFDYAILDRPIILFTYDMEEYKDKLRGMYIDIRDNKPGPILYTSDEVEDAIINIDETERKYKKFRDEFRKKFNQYECGNSSEKIFNIMFKNK